MILRWYWWRINAWSEISALVSSGVTATALKLSGAFDGPNQVALSLLVTVAVASVVWLTVTFLTQPESDSDAGALLRARSSGRREARDRFTRLGRGCGLVYGMLFGIGKFCLGEVGVGIGCLALQPFA